MSSLKYIKLRNREELFAYVEEESKYTSRLIAPMTLYTDSSYGLIGKYWITFCDNHDALINNEEILYIGEANEKSAAYYNEFITKMTEVVSESASQTNDSVLDLDDMSEEDLTDFLSKAFDIKSTKLH